MLANRRARALSLPDSEPSRKKIESLGTIMWQERASLEFSEIFELLVHGVTGWFEL